MAAETTAATYERWEGRGTDVRGDAEPWEFAHLPRQKKIVAVSPTAKLKILYGTGTHSDVTIHLGSAQQQMRKVKDARTRVKQQFADLLGRYDKIVINTPISGESGTCEFDKETHTLVVSLCIPGSWNKVTDPNFMKGTMWKRFSAQCTLPEHIAKMAGFLPMSSTA